jgi:hypothetical protein
MAVLQDYENYLKALRGEKAGSVPNTMYNTKRNTTPTGFMEFKPRDELAQAKYDALSPTWEGVESSEKAIARGDYDLDQAEKNRNALRRQQIPPKTTEPPRTVSSSCVIV